MASSFKPQYGTVTVGNAATLIFDATVSPISGAGTGALSTTTWDVFIINSEVAANTVFVGFDTSVTTGNGYLIPGQGQLPTPIRVPAHGKVYGIAAANRDIRYMAVPVFE